MFQKFPAIKGVNYSWLSTSTTISMNYFLRIASCSHYSELLQKTRTPYRKQIIKRRKLAPLSDVAKPLLSFYATSGKRDTDNPLLLTSFFRLDVITPGDIELAHQIANHLFHLLDGKSLSMNGIEGLDMYVVSQLESDTGHSSAYCFTLVTKFTLQVC
ncbi:hypothetical protein [Brevibacillus brevis]|uniref:hypothetical protein n=1 Tax=Brevibacillus brevis TaxID=1393 RepID=UPI0020A45574|nr:hypothetical protein [Brevibacillus brevis]